MNLRKFISGVSALTIAASAFAAMAVTASAADTYYFGSANGAETFSDSYVVSGFSATRNGVVLANSDDNYYLDVPCSGTSGSTYVYNYATYGFNEISNGTASFTATLNFAADYAHAGTTIAFIDSDGNVVASIQYKARNTSQTSDYAVIANSSSSWNATSLPRINTRSDSNVVTGLTVDLDQKTFTASVNGSSQSGTLSNSTNVAGIKITVGSPGGTNGKSNHVYFDDVTFYTSTVAGQADFINLSYRTNINDATTEVTTQNVDIRSQEVTDGGTASYYLPKYVTTGNGVYYAVEGVSETTLKSATVAEGTTTIPVAVTLDPTVVYFVEGENHSAVNSVNYTSTNTRNDFSSGSGREAHGSNSSTTSGYLRYDFTINEAGKYSINAPMYNANSKERGYTVGIDNRATASTDTGYVTSVAVSGSSSATLSTEYDLTASSHQLFFSSTSQAAPYIDYIVIRKLSNTVTVDPAISNGTVESDVEYAKPGDTVTLTVTPDTNYAVGTVSVNGTPITPDNGVYSFAMPSQAATVTATFVSTFVDTNVSAPEEVAFENVDDGVTAKAYTFTVTPGTNAVTSITVTPDADHTMTKTVNLTSGDVIFGVLFATSTEGVTLPTLTSGMITVD